MIYIESESTWQISSSVAGLRVAKVLPLTASTHWLLMKSFVNFTSGRDILLLSDDPDQMQVALLLFLLILYIYK